LTLEYRERLFSQAERSLGSANPLRSFTTLEEVRNESNAARRAKHSAKSVQKSRRSFTKDSDSSSDSDEEYQSSVISTMKMHQRIQSLKADNAELKKELKDISVKHQNLQREFDELAADKEVVDDQVENLTHQLSQQQTQGEELKKEVRSLTREVQSQKKEITIVKENLAKLQESHDTLQTSHDTLRTAHSELKNQFDEKCAENTALLQKLTNMEQMIQSVVNQLTQPHFQLSIPKKEQQ
jgi:chromosome segregation ATPase